MRSKQRPVEVLTRTVAALPFSPMRAKLGDELDARPPPPRQSTPHERLDSALIDANAIATWKGS